MNGEPWLRVRPTSSPRLVGCSEAFRNCGGCSSRRRLCAPFDLSIEIAFSVQEQLQRLQIQMRTVD